MAAPVVRYLRRLTTQAAMHGRGPAIARNRSHQLLIYFGRVAILLGAIVLKHQVGTSTTAAASGNTAAPMLVAFIIWLLGAALAMLSLVALQFPRLAAAGAATALRNNLLGGL